MAELKTPNVDLSYGWDLGEDGWKTGMDGNFQELDSLLFLVVIDKDLSAPAGGESAGDTYIVGTSPTGAWAGHEYDIAYYTGTSWNFYDPQNGWRAIVQDENYATYTYVSSAWSLNTSFYGNTRIAQPASGDQVSVTPTNVDGVIAALPIGATYSQTEVQALRDACETVADDMRNNNDLLLAIRIALVNLGLIKGSA